ncbi:unnamed protein product [Arabidopsis lyrata]|nr:unnamed protein product [Arabidopsis lyrata]
MAETRSMLLNEVVVRETEEVLGRLEQAIAEQNQKLDESFAKLIGAIRLISDNVNDVSSCGHLQQKRSSPVASMTPNHYLQHKNSGFNTFNPEIHSRSKKESMSDHVSSPIEEFQVPISHLEPSLPFRSASLVDTSMAAYDELHVQNVAACCEKSTEVYTKVDAYQVFDNKLPQVSRFQQMMKDEKLSKSWQFKFKNGLETSVLIEEQLSYRDATISQGVTRDQLLEGDIAKLWISSNNGKLQPHDHYVLDRMFQRRKRVQKKTQTTRTSKTWMFKYKSRSRTRALVQEKLWFMSYVTMVKSVYHLSAGLPLRRNQMFKTRKRKHMMSFKARRLKFKEQRHPKFLPQTALNLTNKLEIMKNNRVHSQSGFEYVKNKNNRHQVFDGLLLRKYKSQQRRKLSLSPKSWKFKYKEVNVLRRLPQNEHDNLRGGMIIKKLHEMSKVDSGFNQKTRIELEMYGWNYKKPINPDQIRLKSMCEVAELQGIESRAFNKRIRELLFGYYGFKVQLLPDFKKRGVVIVEKKAPNVDITATNKQLEYTREGRWEKEDEFEHVVNHTPFSVEKLVRLRDRDAVLIKQFLLSDEKFHIKHKWRSKFLHSISELVLCFDSVELSISYANSGDYLLKRGSSTVHSEYSMWKQNDQWTKLFGSRRRVIHTVGREKTVEEMYQRVDQLVNMKLANVGKMLAVTQSQTFDPLIRLEAKETLRSYVSSRAVAMVLMVRTHESTEETTWEFSLFCSDNSQTLNHVVKVLQTGEI